MRAAITGASGLLGANLAIELIKLGYQARCTKRGASRTDHLKEFEIEWVEADINDTSSLIKAFSNCDVVFHCAAQVSIKAKVTPALIRGNVEGTASVLAAVKQTRVPRLVHCSSVVARAISEDGKPVTEDQPWNFPKFGLADGYAVTKYQSEQLVCKAIDEIDAVIVNPCYLLGPYDLRPSSGKMIIDVVKGNVPGVADGKNNFVDARDVARGMISAWQKGRRGEAYILGGENLTYQEAMYLIAKVAGVAPPRFKLPHAVAMIAGWMGDLKEAVTGRDALINSIAIKYGYCKNYFFSSEKAKRELGYKPGSLEIAIQDAIEWFRKNGMLN